MFHRNRGTVGDTTVDIFAPVADLMVAVVFVFIILTLALSSALQHEQLIPRSDYEARVAELSAVRVRLAEVEREASAAAGRYSSQSAAMKGFVNFVRDESIVPLMQRLAQADQTRSAILGQVRQRLVEQGVDVSVNQAAGTLALPAGKLFGSGRSDPSVEGRETILKLGRVLTEILPCYATECVGPASRANDGVRGRLSAVYIEGHSDVAPFGGPSGGAGRFRNNWDLSAGRAIEAYSLLRTQFEQIRELRNDEGQALVGVSGYADTRPAVADGADRRDADVMERDRRIELRFVMSTDSALVGAVLRTLQDRLDVLERLESPDAPSGAVGFRRSQGAP